VSKQARVKEELVVKKGVDQRTETTSAAVPGSRRQVELSILLNTPVRSARFGAPSGALALYTELLGRTHHLRRACDPG
jgi:hypothetical protein